MIAMKAKKLLESFPAPEPWVCGRAWKLSAINIINDHVTISLLRIDSLKLDTLAEVISIAKRCS